MASNVSLPEQVALFEMYLSAKSKYPCLWDEMMKENDATQRSELKNNYIKLIVEEIMTDDDKWLPEKVITFVSKQCEWELL